MTGKLGVVERLLCDGPDRHGARAKVGGGLLRDDRPRGRGGPNPECEAGFGGGVSRHEEPIREFAEDFSRRAVVGRETAKGLR